MLPNSICWPPRNCTFQQHPNGKFFAQNTTCPEQELATHHLLCSKIYQSKIHGLISTADIEKLPQMRGHTIPYPFGHSQFFPFRKAVYYMNLPDKAAQAIPTVEGIQM